MRHAILIKEGGRLLQLGTASTAENEVVQSDAILVESVSSLRHRPLAHQEIAARHDDAAPHDWAHRFGGRITRRWQLGGRVKPQ